MEFDSFGWCRGINIPERGFGLKNLPWNLLRWNRDINPLPTERPWCQLQLNGAMRSISQRVVCEIVAEDWNITLIEQCFRTERRQTDLIRVRSVR